MLEISRRQIKAWAKVDGEPGYLLTSGAKVKQSSVKFVEQECPNCKRNTLQYDEPKRMEAYLRRFAMCLKCHAFLLFPNDEGKRNRFYLNMYCKKSISAYGIKYQVDQLLRIVKKEIM